VPLDPELRASGDAGEPLVWADPETESSRAIAAVAERVVAMRPPQIVKQLSVVS
jgi:ATP-binding protein involved in chromosome partitioning